MIRIGFLIFSLSLYDTWNRHAAIGCIGLYISPDWGVFIFYILIETQKVHNSLPCVFFLVCSQGLYSELCILVTV